MMPKQEAVENEEVIIRFNGGPFPGSRVFPLAMIDPENPQKWPPPDFLKVPGDNSGYYAQVAASALPPMAKSDTVIRGAEYRWIEEQS